MSLRFTVLGFLDMAPMTGYQVKRSMDSSTRFFWQAELSQIYPTLKQLEAEALVVATIEPRSGKPDKKIYTMTPAGRDALTAWLTEPIAELPKTKDPLLLKLFFAGAARYIDHSAPASAAAPTPDRARSTPSDSSRRSTHGVSRVSRYESRMTRHASRVSLVGAGG